MGLNLILDLFGLGPFNWVWFSDSNWGMVAISFAASWQMVGYTMALYFAGIRGISQDLREAAQIDGAGTIALYRHVIVPLLRPVSLTAFIILFGLALRLFDLVAAISGTGLNFLDRYIRLPHGRTGVPRPPNGARSGDSRDHGVAVGNHRRSLPLEH